MTDPEIDELYIPKSTRTGVTQLGMAAAAYYVGHKHSQVMFVQPVEQKAQEFANDYLTPAFRDSPYLSNIVRKPVKGERQDTWDVRLYANGGMFRLGWASSDGTFRGRTAQMLFGDEWDDDGWSPTSEKSQGDKAKLFKDRGKNPRRVPPHHVVVAAAPEDEPRLAGVREDRQAVLFRPLSPLQGEADPRMGDPRQPLRREAALRRGGRFVSAYYMCRHCEELIPDDRETREWMDDNGEWRATDVAARRRVCGMHISALYSMAPKVSWSTLWEEWTEAQGDPDALKHFFNSNLGLPWDDVVVEQGADPGSFAETRPRPYKAEVPLWARCLTIGADLQRGHDDVDRKDYRPPRIELQVLAWGPREECAVVGYYVVPCTNLLDADCQAAIDAIAGRAWTREDGKKLKGDRRRDGLLVPDGRGHHVLPGPPPRPLWIPVRGENETSIKLSPFIVARPGVHAQTGRQFTVLGTRSGKNTLIRRLRNETPGPGYLHFPKSLQAGMPDGYDYFAGLFAEKSHYDKKGSCTGSGSRRPTPASPGTRFCTASPRCASPWAATTP